MNHRERQRRQRRLDGLEEAQRQDRERRVPLDSVVKERLHILPAAELEKILLLPINGETRTLVEARIAELTFGSS